MSDRVWRPSHGHSKSHHNVVVFCLYERIIYAEKSSIPSQGEKYESGDRTKKSVCEQSEYSDLLGNSLVLSAFPVVGGK